MVSLCIFPSLCRRIPMNHRLTRFVCGHVGAEIGVKAKAFVRWAEARSYSIEDDLKKKCPDCK
jgi:hypothetical protein